MGTMCNQPARPRREIDTESTKAFMEMVKEIAKEHHIPFEAALKVYEVMAYERRTNIMIDNGDFTDENMCGIGTAIKEIAEQIHDVADALEEIARNSHE